MKQDLSWHQWEEGSLSTVVAKPGDVSLELPVASCHPKARACLRMKNEAVQRKAKQDKKTGRSPLTFFEHLDLAVPKARTINEFFSYLNI